MDCRRKVIPALVLGGIGLVLLTVQLFGVEDAFFSGMGTSFLVVGAIRLVQAIRYGKDPEYQERVDVAASDERNRFLAGRAWALAGWLFVLIAAVGSIGFYIAGQTELSQLCSGGVCILALLYAVSYLILRKKY